VHVSRGLYFIYMMKITQVGIDGEENPDERAMAVLEAELNLDLDM
jgi:hypothetical protein